MNITNKNMLKDKIRTMCGLTTILKNDIDILRINVYESDSDKTHESLQEAYITIQNLISVVDQIDYILKLDKIEGP